MTELKDVKVSADVSSQPITNYVTYWGNIKGDIYKQSDLIALFDKMKKLGSGITDSFKRVLDRVSNIAIDSAKYQVNSVKLESESSEGDYYNFLTYNISPEGKPVLSTKEISLPTKEKIESLKTSDLENDGEGEVTSEGAAIKFATTKDVNDLLEDTLVEINDRFETVENDVNVIDGNLETINENIYNIQNELNFKQDHLIAGDNITIEDIGSGTLISAQLSGDILPEVTASDNGKVLKVVNGAWGVGVDEKSEGGQVVDPGYEITSEVSNIIPQTNLSLTKEQEDPVVFTNLTITDSQYFELFTDSDVITVNWDGVDYTCQKQGNMVQHFYGGTINNADGTVDFSEYPFVIANDDRNNLLIGAEDAQINEHTIKIDRTIKTATITEDFKVAVDEVLSQSPLIVNILHGQGYSLDQSYYVIESALHAGRQIYISYNGYISNYFILYSSTDDETSTYSVTLPNNPFKLTDKGSLINGDIPFTASDIHEQLVFTIFN